MAQQPNQRIALITGASRGIGEASAHLLARQGRHVVLVSRSADAMEGIAEAIRADGGTASTEPCDVSDSAALEAIVESVIDEYDRLDILVNNAGMTRDTLLLRMSDADWDDVMRVNLRSAFVACRSATRAMLRHRWGRVINIASVAGVVGNAGQCNYAAAKAGLVGLTKSIAKELASKQITANVIAPGFIDTRMTRGLPDPIKQGARDLTPMRRFGQVHEIASAVAYFASDDASYTTGQVLCIDGGMTMC